MIDGVEAHQRGEEPPVGLGHALPTQPGLTAQALFQTIQRREQLVVGFFVGFLGGREAAAIDTIVDAVVDLRVDRIDLAPERLGVIVIVIAGEAVEGRVEHTDDFR